MPVRVPAGTAPDAARTVPGGVTEEAAGVVANAPAAAHLRMIDRDRLASQLGESARAWPIEIVAQTTSTNADLLQALRAERGTRGQQAPGGAHGLAGGLAQPRVKVAYEQTAGRGRRGRSWVAQPGDALLFSVGGQVPRGVDGLAGLSLAVGLAVYEALCELPVDRSQLALKWPNDVLVGGAKVSGILIETAGGDAQTTAVVVGIGINLHGAAMLAARLNTGGDLQETAPQKPVPQQASTPQALTQHASTQHDASRPAETQPAESQQPASAQDMSQAPGSPASAPPTPPTALDAIWDAPSMTDLLATLLNTLARTFERFGAQGFAPFRQAWCEADAYRGQPVVLYEGGTAAVHGVGRGVDAQGQLLLETPQGLRTIASGDVSLRRA
jgi:BirA family biotin operon repressor/biotin-[acetyl-CoA-carboxylase] ligase